MTDEQAADQAADQAAWHEQRQRAVAEHGAALRRRQAAERDRALALVAEFVAAARERGLPTEPLTARPYHGRGRYRTGLRGWYLTGDVAVGADGGYYVLAVAPSLRGRLAGVTPAPAEPRLIVGEGGRDGESMPLEKLLRRRLDGDRQ